MLVPADLRVPVPCVVRDVLGHGFVGVEPDLAKAKTAGVLLGQGQQPGADPAALGSGQHRHVLQQQVAGLGDLYTRALRFASGLEPAERAGLLERFAELTLYTRMGEEGAAALREAVEIHRARGDLLRQGDALRRLGIRLGANGALAEATAVLAEAVTVLEQVPAGPELARTYNAMAAVLGVFDDGEALRWGEKAIDLAERVGCVDAIADTLNIVGTAQLRLGDLDGLVKLDRSRELAQQAGDELGVVRATSAPRRCSRRAGSGCSPSATLSRDWCSVVSAAWSHRWRG